MILVYKFTLNLVENASQSMPKQQENLINLKILSNCSKRKLMHIKTAIGKARFDS